MISVNEARAQLFSLISPLESEGVSLIDAVGRTLAKDAIAKRDQPPFAASSMDGYALKSVEAERDAMFKVIGESAAGHRFDGTVGPGQTVRIFTGAPMPKGADFVVIQEDVSRSSDLITLTETPNKSNVRPAGGDFKSGDAITAPRILRPEEIALLASMNVPSVQVARRPVIALISTGDELVMPGEDPGPDQIIASNTFGLKALLENAGAQVRILPIARDTVSSLTMAFTLAEGADLIITIGGASVGDHDLVGPVAQSLGMERAFYKIRMRPGKPLMAGRMGRSAMVGLPGNPVSAMVCGVIFIIPMIRLMLGLGADPAALSTAPLAHDIGPNGDREHYMRAAFSHGKIQVFDNQDSSLLSVLAMSNVLIVRPPNDPARRAGERLEYLQL
ncbi:MAG: molybdopterin molybdotransferase MoeA [Rhodobacteraceae bacterium]|nr:molybdopterin molybdotransferase MoeA [Paracoccaceae bacterium]